MRRLALGAASGLWLAGVAAAQVPIPGDRPADAPLELPPLETGDAVEAPILPPYPIPTEPSRAGVAGGLRVELRAVLFEGATVVPEALLQQIAAPYLGRPVEWSDLLELRDRVTLALVDRGYRTSGATLPEQTIRDGVLRVQIVEGRIADVVIETDGRFREGVLRRRLRGVVEGPVDVPRLEQRLQQLQRDRRIERVDARLEPTAERGVSILRLRIEEAPPLALRAEFDNARSPAIGALGGRFVASVDNALGWGDAVSARAELSEGLQQYAALASLPISPWETRLGLHFQWSRADVVEGPIEALKIASRSRTLSVELSQPLPSLFGGELETQLRGELRRARTRLDGAGTSFVAGPENGLSKVTVLRLGVEWTRRGRVQALALRSLLSLGLDALDATRHRDGRPDGQFLAWLGQLHWARRLPWLGVELRARAELQLSNSPLLPLEQLAIGGRDTIRGYRENIRVGDDGVLGSLEVRVPVYSRVEPQLRWELVPFVDVGSVWNTKRGTKVRDTLASVGLGTRFDWADRAGFELFWGHALKRVDRSAPRDLQDDGIHLRVSLRWP